MQARYMLFLDKKSSTKAHRIYNAEHYAIPLKIFFSDAQDNTKWL
jgi:hypothetical protein